MKGRVCPKGPSNSVACDVSFPNMAVFLEKSRLTPIGCHPAVVLRVVSRRRARDQQRRGAAEPERHALGPLLELGRRLIKSEPQAH